MIEYRNLSLLHRPLAAAVLGLSLLTACSTTQNPLEDMEEVTAAPHMDAPVPDADRAASRDPAQLERGKYMVELLGCSNCHTDGALVGRPDPARRLAGSRIGIAFTNPLDGRYPGVVYPANLTPDDETGIGTWTDEHIIQLMRMGIDNQGRRHLSVMPWPAYSRINDEDAAAIASYLRSLAPVRHRVPASVNPGTKASSPYVHYGVYQSRKD